MGKVPQTPLALSVSKGALSALALVAVSGCSAQAPSGDAAADADDRIECALGGDDFVRACQLERSKVDGVPILIVRHPDGGFRRFEVMSDGTGLAAADGAERAEVSLREQGIEVAIGTDRYRFPARIMGDGAR